MDQSNVTLMIFRPQALITPAISHAEVIVAAVAARDPKKAEAFAKKHGIPIVHKTYDGMLVSSSFPYAARLVRYTISV
jgi:predicted dehydrogenase